MKRRYEIGNMFWFYDASICTDRWERTWVIVFMSQGWVRAEGDVHEDLNQNLGLFRQPLPYNIHVRGEHDQTLYHHLVTKTHMWQFLWAPGNGKNEDKNKRMRKMKKMKRLKGWGISRWCFLRLGPSATATLPPVRVILETADRADESVIPKVITLILLMRRLMMSMIMKIQEGLKNWKWGLSSTWMVQVALQYMYLL